MAGRRSRWISSAGCWPPPIGGPRDPGRSARGRLSHPAQHGRAASCRHWHPRPVARLDAAVSCWRMPSRCDGGPLPAHVSARSASFRRRCARRIWRATCTCCPFPAACSWGAPPTLKLRQELPLADADAAVATLRAAREPRAGCGCRSRAGCTSRIREPPDPITTHGPIRNHYRPHPPLGPHPSARRTS